MADHKTTAAAPIRHPYVIHGGDDGVLTGIATSDERRLVEQRGD